RYRLAALDTTTGLATTFDPFAGLSEGITALYSLHKMGSTLYVGGEFLINNRQSILAIDIPTQSITSFNPSLRGSATPLVRAITSHGGRIYLGGFWNNTHGGQVRINLLATDGFAPQW
ncbi:MAG: hypothetical protein NZ480_03060, partial [Bdellovibrionaceae bacterium]|nr:hypothetical protein [Pseudobdellovibrionaceae bacterium]